MSSFTRIALSSIRSVRRAWPLPFGREFGTYAGAFATKIGLLGSEWYEFQPRLWMRLNIRDLVQQTILLEGVWDPALTAFIESTLRPNNIFIDVGAHVGYFTLLASRRVGPGGRVLAIEPNPTAMDQLRQNVERSDLHNVLLEHTACGESRSMVKLHLHTESNSSMASLYAATATGGTAVEVPCTSLDDLCRDRDVQQVSLVKVDVEGAELSVLQGMGRIMREMRPVIVLELHPQLLEDVGTPFGEVVALLEDFDYRLEPLGGHANYVCRPSATSIHRRRSTEQAVDPGPDP